MTVNTEAADRLASWCGTGLPTVAASLRALAAERDAIKAEHDVLRAERNAERNARFKAEEEFSHMQRRIARQRRALAKLYKRRHDRKAERDYLEKTALQAAQCHGRETLRADGLQAENARLRPESRKLRRLVRILLENDPDDMAADAVTVLDVWRKEAREFFDARDKARQSALAEAARLARHYATIVPMHGSLKSDIYEAAGQAATEIAASIEALAEKELLCEDIIRADRDAWPDHQAKGMKEQTND
jgi:hypothetical protein